MSGTIKLLNNQIEELSNRLLDVVDDESEE